MTDSLSSSLSSSLQTHHQVEPAIGTISRPESTPMPANRADKVPTRVAEARFQALLRFSLSITGFTILGHLWLGLEQSPITPLATLAYGYALGFTLESLWSRSRGRPPAWRQSRRAFLIFAMPIHIASLATSMLIYGHSSMWPYMFAVTVALGSKYIFRVRTAYGSRHFLNPSNTGVAAVVVLFPWVGIAPTYQYTNNVVGALDWIVPATILMLGTMLNLRLTRRFPLILAWLGGFALQALIRALFFDAAFISALTPLTGVGMVLFTNYMVTDPSTTPSSRNGQIVFGLTMAALYGFFVANNIVFGMFFALVVTCAGRGALLAWQNHRHASHRIAAV